MMRSMLLVPVALGILAGCGGVPYSDPYASPDFSRQAECERAGGYWNRTAGVCESPLYRW